VFRDLEKKPKLLRITTVALSLDKLLEGQLSYMSNYFDVEAVCSPSNTIDRIAKREGTTIHEIPMHRGISPLRDIISIFRLVKLIRKIKPDVMHSHTPKAGLVAMIAGKICGVKYSLHTVAGLPLEVAKGFKRKILLAVERLIYRLAYRVYPNSYGLQDFILKNKLIYPENKQKVVARGSSNGINLDHFKTTDSISREAELIKRTNNISKENLVLTFVGRLVKDKGIEELIFAFERLHKYHGHVKLLVVGPFEEKRDPISNEAKQLLSNHESIIPVGLQMDIRPYLACTDIFVFPSYREGLPNVVLQAGAYGLPLIGTSIIGTQDIVKHNVNGYLVKARSQDELLMAMLHLIEHPDLRTRIGAKLKETVYSQYDQKLVWESLKNEYFEILKLH